MTRTVEGNVVSVDRVGTSRDGNPTYDITMEGGAIYRTSVDASVGYAAPNYRPHRIHCPVSTVVLTLNKNGRVIDMKRPDGTDA
jgi:hypothetical protein